MVQNPQLVTVVGGTGFVGTYVVRRLVKEGYQVRVLCRDPQGADAGTIKTQGYLGQISVEYADLSKPKTLEGKLNGSFAVINLVGVLYEKGRQNFADLHAKGAEILAQMASAAGVTQFVQMSALGVDKASKSRYARTKFLGEKAVLQAFPTATILRPSVVFGREDNFFNQFASMARIAPFLPVIGGGKTKFQPVYVDDVAQAISAILKNENARGKIYEIGGPEVMSFRQVIEFILTATDRDKPILDIPFAVAGAMGLFSEFTPKPMLTRDQVALLRYDNVVSEEMPGLRELGVQPTAIELIVPEYLSRFRLRTAAA
jgi:NADH dehydrogenase